MIRKIACIAAVSASLVTAACSSSVGAGGGAVGAGTSGGAVNSPCKSANQGEGCYAPYGAVPQRMKCENDAWASIETCGAGTACVESPDPAAPAKKVTACQAPNQPIVDAGGTGGKDGTVIGGDDTGTGADVNATDSIGTDIGGKDITIVNDTSGGNLLSCLMEMCSGEWAKCQANAQCESLANCAAGCGNNTSCVMGCTSQASGSTQSLLASLMQCGTSAGCIGGSTGPVCGNGTCESGESKSTCPADCGSTSPVCGNGKCESGETKTNCLIDCGSGPACGNGTCESGESKANCPADCGSTAPVCGNGMCESGETKTSCAKDCGTTTATCGDGTCSSSESKTTCPPDCDPAVKCLYDNCSSEIQSCQSTSACNTFATCVQGCAGNASCQQSCATKAGNTAVQLYNAVGQCAQDAGCSGSSGGCGDGTCDASETPIDCEQDCPVADCVSNGCGNEQQDFGTVAGGEAMITCFQDCGENSTCLQNCYTKAPPAAQQAYQALIECAIDNGCIAGN